MSESEGRKLLQIGEAAERVGLSLRTMRYYEEVGLARPSARSDGGFRLYSEEDVERLLLVRRMKPLGLTLDEMRELAELLERTARVGDFDRDVDHIAARLSEYADRGDERIVRLERDLSEARILRVRIGESLGRCDAVAARPRPEPER